MHIYGFILLILLIVIGGCFWFAREFYYAPKWAFEELCSASQAGNKTLAEVYIDRDKMSKRMESAMAGYIRTNQVVEDTNPQPGSDINSQYINDTDHTPLRNTDVLNEALFSEEEAQEIIYKMINRTFVNIAETNQPIRIDTRDQAANVTAIIAMPDEKSMFIAEFRMLKRNNRWKVSEWVNYRQYFERLVQRDLVNSVIR